jgi:hypothetical protein
VVIKIKILRYVSQLKSIVGRRYSLFIYLLVVDSAFNPHELHENQVNNYENTIQGLLPLLSIVISKSIIIGILCDWAFVTYGYYVIIEFVLLQFVHLNLKIYGIWVLTFFICNNLWLSFFRIMGSTIRSLWIIWKIC